MATCTTCGNEMSTKLATVCNACRVIDAKPRTAVTLPAALAFAREQVKAGGFVHIREVNAAFPAISITRHNIDDFEIDPATASVMVYAVAER